MTFSVYEINQWQVTFRNVTRRQAVKIMQTLAQRKLWTWRAFERERLYFFGGVSMRCTEKDEALHTIDFAMNPMQTDRHFVPTNDC